MLELHVAAHPALDVRAFVTHFPRPLGELTTPATLRALFSPELPAPLASDDLVRKAVRDLLRHGGYKPTGRGKPSSEYLLGAVAEQALAAINLAVDACNAVSYRSGLPISVVDLERARPPLRVEVQPAGTRYVFNPSGQEIDVGGLLCLCDADGPCANAVKDAQRTKTGAATRRTLSLIWGTKSLPNRAQVAVDWYKDLLVAAGATVEDAAVSSAG